MRVLSLLGGSQNMFHRLATSESPEDFFFLMQIFCPHFRPTLGGKVGGSLPLITLKVTPMQV